MSGDMLQIFSEFLGTMMLVLLGDGVCAAVNLKKVKLKHQDGLLLHLDGEQP